MSHNAKPKSKTTDRMSSDMMSESEYAKMPKGSKTRKGGNYKRHWSQKKTGK